MWHSAMMVCLSYAAMTQPAQFKTPAPDFQKVTEWVNSKPLKLSDLKGKEMDNHYFTFEISQFQRF
jgi:hypothetical protein